MIDWKKEVATKNYCGYCKGGPTDSPCEGGCFTDEKNRIDHILTMLQQIPEQISELQLRMEKYRNELTTKTHKTYEKND